MLEIQRCILFLIKKEWSMDMFTTLFGVFIIVSKSELWYHIIAKHMSIMRKSNMDGVINV